MQILAKSPNSGILILNLEEDAVISEYASSTDAHMTVLESGILFHSKGENLRFEKQQYFSFLKDGTRWNSMNMDSKLFTIQ